MTVMAGGIDLPHYPMADALGFNYTPSFLADPHADAAGIHASDANHNKVAAAKALDLTRFRG